MITPNGKVMRSSWISGFPLFIPREYDSPDRAAYWAGSMLALYLHDVTPLTEQILGV